MMIFMIFSYAKRYQFTLGAPP